MGYAFNIHSFGFRHLFRNFARVRFSIRELTLLIHRFRASRFHFCTFALIFRRNYGRRHFHFHETSRFCPLSLQKSCPKHRLYALRNVLTRCFAVSSIQTFVKKSNISHFIPCFSYCACKILCSNLRYYLACSFDLHAQLLFFFIRMLSFQTKHLLFCNTTLV